MKNPFVIYNSKTGEKSIRKWPVYLILGLIFLMNLLLIFSLPSGVKVELEDELPTLPKAADGKNYASKMELYEDLENQRPETFSSRLTYLFSEDSDSTLLSVDDSIPLVADEYSNNDEMFIEDDSWIRSHKAQLQLSSSLEDFTSYREDDPSLKQEAENDPPEADDEEISLLKSLLRQRTEELERLISSLNQQGKVLENSSEIVNISDNPRLDKKMEPSITPTSDQSVKAVLSASQVVSGLGISSPIQESGLLIPVQTPSAQKIYSGELLEVRLLTDVSLTDGTVLEKNTRLFASTSLQGDRLMASIEHVSKNGRLIPLDLEAYSPRDGQKGIEIENALKDNALSDITDRLANATSSSAIRFITSTSSALGSVAEDGLRSLVQGGASYISRKAQRKRVVIPSHLDLFLK